MTDGWKVYGHPFGPSDLTLWIIGVHYSKSIPGPMSPASSRNVLVIPILGPHPRTTELGFSFSGDPQGIFLVHNVQVVILRGALRWYGYFVKRQGSPEAPIWVVWVLPLWSLSPGQQLGRRIPLLYYSVMAQLHFLIDPVTPASAFRNNFLSATETQSFYVSLAQMYLAAKLVLTDARLFIVIIYPTLCDYSYFSTAVLMCLITCQRMFHKTRFLQVLPFQYTKTFQF